MLPWSVIATAGIPCFFTCGISAEILFAPSSSEYWVWRWRWTKDIAARSFPFDRGGRLRRYVVGDSIHAADFIRNPARDPRQQIVRQARPVGGHAVDALDRADRDHVVVGALVAHHADRPHG